jgi:CelD/BcsL family acetyltransferase involved in cellulose biosynthesis
MPFHASTDPAYYMDIQDGFAQYAMCRKKSGSSVISQAERKKRKLQREIGDVRFEYHVADKEVLQQLVEWIEARIVRKGQRNPFGSPWVTELTNALYESQSDTFGGVLSALYAGDQLVSAHFGTRSATLLSSWLPGHSPNFERYSPGLLLTLEMAKSAAARGIRMIDLGRGENPSKIRLASSQQMLAIGEVETRPLKRVLNSSWHFARAASYRFPLLRSAIRALR